MHQNAKLFLREPLGFRSDQRLSFLDRIVLTKRMAFELLIHQYALQVWMTRKTNSKHIPDLTFQPVGTAPERGDGINLRLSFLHPKFDAQALFGLHSEQMV